MCKYDWKYVNVKVCLCKDFSVTTGELGEKNHQWRLLKKGLPLGLPEGHIKGGPFFDVEDPPPPNTHN